MNGSVTGDAAELEAAELVIMRWDSSSVGGGGGEERMLFDGGGGGGGDRSEADRLLRAVDELRRLTPASPARVGSPRLLSSSSSSSSSNAMQVSMARLEDVFRHILSSRALDLELDSLADLAASLSLSSSSFDASDDSESNADGRGDGSSRRNGYRSVQSIREIDLLPPEAVDDLRAVAARMAAAGYGRECVQVYASVRKPAVDSCLRRLGVEKLSIGDVQRLEWESLETKIRRWIRSAHATVRCVFASERRLADAIFDGLPNVAADTPFAEAVKGAALQLFGFAEAISIGRRSPEKLFKIIDLHDALSGLLPDVAAIFGSKSTESIHVQAVEIRSRLADAVRGILSEFENAVLRDPSKVPVPGGTIHPLTRYVMNYISLISDYKATLSELVVSRPSTAARLPDDISASLPELELPEPENQLPLATHLVWIIVVLQHNLQSKAALYKDAALSHLFLMNNVHYIVHKVRDSAELRSMIGDDYLRRLTGNFRQAATSYQRAAWMKILHCLRDEGLHVSGGFSSGISKSTLRERFKAFNAAFEEAHRVQSGWCVPDTQLREELRISIAEKLLPAYRSFLGRFRHHIENGRHPELYIKYSVDDLEMAVSDLFEGSPPSPHNRRRSHG